ncbi:hypothetical protein LY10_01164 [Planktotalea frisia]|uniref:DUF4258 domain-containing protein n=1 Tax=Planktotalea frisia TaxID=696762 RepID=A0A1L9P0N9_9RHOB|nr:hypothetical protein [Planktotalea frisia]OJI95003.1 hypothetical protein PFRI_07110 [Planktotalea frisia]PZX31552.1 hypothetical protein LY10_01164 [Planktotalea frisia]
MLNTIQTKNTTRMSKHASIRAQQRGVKLSAIEVVFDYGDIETNAGSGSYKLKISRELLDGLVQTKIIGRQLAETCQRLTLVVSGKSIVTCYRARLH